MANGALDFSAGSVPVDTKALDFSAASVPVSKVSAGAMAGRQFVAGGGDLLNALDSIGSMMDPGRAIGDAMLKQQLATTPAAAGHAQDLQDTLHPLGAYARAAHDFGDLSDGEMADGLGARVAGNVGRVIPSLAGAIATGGESSLAGALPAAVRSVPVLGRVATAVAGGAPTAASLTGIQASNLPDAMPAGDKAKQVAQDLGINLAMAGLPAAIGKSLLARIASGAGIGYGSSAGISALQGQPQDQAANLAGALMGGVLGQHSAAHTPDVTDPHLDAYMRSTPHEGHGPDLSADSVPVTPLALPAGADFSSDARVIKPSGGPVPSPGPIHVDPTGQAFTPEQGRSELGAAMEAALNQPARPALPGPVVSVDKAGTAMSSADFLAKAKAAQAAAEAQGAASQQRTDLGITPDIERTQRGRWEAQHAAALDLQARLDAQGSAQDELAQQGTDDTPPWWMGARGGELDHEATSMPRTAATTSAAAEAAASSPVTPRAAAPADTSTGNAEMVPTKVTADPVKLPPPPELPAAPYDMTPDEIAAHADAVKSYGGKVEDAVLGDKADAWRAAHRQMNSSNDAISARGEAAIQSIEAALPESQKNALYGIGGKGEHFDEMGDFKDAHDAATMIDTPDQAAAAVARLLPKLGNTKGRDPSGWTREQQVAYAGMRSLRERIDTEGWDSSSIQRQAMQRAAGRYSDANDAGFMLDRFMQPAKSSRSKIDAPTPKQIASQTDESVAEPVTSTRVPDALDSTDATRQASIDQGNADADRLGIRAAVTKALGPVADRVEYLHGYAGLPENMRKGVESRNALGRKGVTAAMYSPDTGRVFLFTDIVKTADRAVWHAAHEIAGHAGLRALLGDRLDPALNIALQNPTVKALADEIFQQRKIGEQMKQSGKSHADGLLLSAEEALAELGAAIRTGDFEQIKSRYGVDVPPGIREKVKAAIANFLKRLKAMIDDLFGKHTFSDADVRDLMESAWQAAKESPAASKPREAAMDRMAAEPREVDSTEDQTDTPAFKRWFGDSKVVDAQGKPLVVYHGTSKRFSRVNMKKGAQGLFWMTSDKAAIEAGEVGASGRGVIMDLYAKVENPAGWDEYGKKGIGELIRDGFDGLILPDDGAVTVVAFDRSQVKSADRNNGNFDPAKPSILESLDPGEEQFSHLQDMPSRRPGESQSDYTRRVMRKNGDEIKQALQLAKRQRDIGRLGMRAMWATQDRTLAKADAAFAQYRKLFDKEDQAVNLRTIDQWETGRPIADYDARQFFDTMKEAFDQRTAKIQALAPDAMQQLIDHYFPHIWEDSSRALKWYQGLSAKRPLQGDRSFLKQRVHATIKDGMASGLKPVSTNPVDLAILKLGQMDKFIAFHEFRADLQKRGWLRKMDAGERVPVGYARVDDPAFQIAGGLQGYHAVPELIARDINNYLSPSLYRFGAWKALRTVQNVLMSSRLGLSMFHGGFTTMDNLVMHADVAGRRMMAGDLAGGLGTLLKAPLSIVWSPIEGGKLNKEWLGLTPSDQHTAAILDMLEQGGAHMKMSATDYNNALPKLIKAVRQKSATGTLKQTLPALGEAISWIIHHKLVPNQKMAARVMLAKFELDRVAGTLGKKRGDYAGIINALHPDALKQIAAHVVDLVDDRLGQMNYDNQFWNKTAREASQAAIGAVGWQVGTLRTVTGGVRDLVHLWKPEKLLSTLDKAGKLDGDLGRVSGRLTYLVTLALLMGGLSAVTQYLLTGKGPEEIKDYFYPKTGNTNDDGSDERLQWPSYWSDHYKLATHPLQTATHKINPSIGMLMEALSNQDYFGTEIRNEDDSWWKQAGQVGAYLAKGFIPYSITGAQKNSDTGVSAGRQVANFFGITKAPASVSRSKFQAFVADKAYDAMPQGSRSQAQAQHSQAMHAAESAIRRGQTPDMEGLTDADRRNVDKAARQETPAIRFRRLGIEDKLRAYDLATPGERERYQLAPMILRSNWHKAIRDLPDAERDDVLEKIQALTP